MVNHRIKFDEKAVYSVKDFLKKGIVITWTCRFRYSIDDSQGFRAWFRGENLFAEIRKCGDKWAVDTSEATNQHWYHKYDTCQSTECNTIREAKSLVWSWFESKGWHRVGFENTYFSPMVKTSHYKPIVEYFL